MTSISQSNQGGYFLIIPAYIADDSDIPAAAKLFYGRLTQLTSQQGYCWASNDYLAQLCYVSPREIQRWLLKLKEKNYISIEMSEKDRRIFTTLSSFKKQPTHDKNVMGVRQKCPTNKEKESVKRKESVVSGGCPPLDVEKSHISEVVYEGGHGKETLTSQKLFQRALEEKEDLTTEEILYAMKALGECRAKIWNWWQFVCGTIKNLRNKKKSENITNSKKGTYQCKTGKKRESSFKKDSLKALAAAQQDSSAPLSPISILNLIQQLESPPGVKIQNTSLS